MPMACLNNLHRCWGVISINAAISSRLKSLVKLLSMNDSTGINWVYLRCSRAEKKPIPSKIGYSFPPIKSLPVPEMVQYALI